jgi:protein involved in polysaccharide export with SLBB domain
MGRLRTIRVYVVGEVRQPGSFTLSSLSTVTNALFSGGGPLKLGSLRNIEIKRNHHTVGTLDLYDFLLRGDKTRDFRLESGDTIFIPPIGSIAAIAGEVKRPAIYELKGPTRVNDLIEMAGGLTPQSYLKRVQVIRAKPNAEREVVDLDLTTLQANGDSPVDIELRNGDLVKIYPTDPRIYNTISLAGVVKYPGEYEIKPSMHLSQLLPRGSVLPEAYLNGVEVIRFKEDLTTEVISADLKKAWAGDQAQDIALRPRDQFTVRSEFQGHKSITIAGEVRLPGTYTVRSGERLSSVIKRAGGFTEKGFLKGAVFIRRSVQEVERKRMEEFMRLQEDRLLAERYSFMAGLQSISTQTAGGGLTMADYNYAQKREQLKEVASRVTIGRIVLRLDEPEKLTGTPNDILLEDGDTLTIPQKPAVVLVMGNVRHPTAIIHKDEEDIQYYLNRAGGFAEAADQSGMYLLKVDGSALTGFLRLRDVEPGDAIVVPPRSQDRYDWNWVKDLATLATQTFLSVAALAAIF